MKIFYDGDCYFCKHYAEFAKLRSVVGEVELISLRSNDKDIESVRERGFKVNRGFVVEHDGEWLEGDLAFSYLNSLMRGDGFLQKILGWIARRRQLGAVFYRLLVFGRYLVLVLQGLTLIDLDANSSPTRHPKLARAVRICLALSLTLLLYSAVAHTHSGNHWAALYASSVTLLSFLGFLWTIQRPKNIENLLRKLSKGGWWPFLIFLLVFLAVVNAGTPIALRRFLGFFWSVPVWGLLIVYARRACRLSSSRNSIAWLPATAFLFAAVPGFMAGPFYGGIAGWVIRASETDPVHVSGYKLINSKGQSHWLSHAFFQPHGQIGRFERAFRAMPNATERDFFVFAFETYKRSYPGIVAGNFPHQWALGALAYPTHSLQKYDTDVLARDFPPSDIVAIERTLEIYDFKGRLLEIQTLGRYEIEDLAPSG